MAVSMNRQPLSLDDDRCFSADSTQLRVARELYGEVKDLPIVSPHGHVNPRLLADEDSTWGNPTDLLLVPDHYIFRMLYSQGVTLESLSIPARADADVTVEQDKRVAWQRFAEKFYLFRGTPTGFWLADVLVRVFGVRHKLTATTAQEIYDQIAEQLDQPSFRPRAMFDNFKIEVLSTTDKASDDLHFHQQIRESAWGKTSDGRPKVRPAFRPDAVVNLDFPNWRGEIDALSKAWGHDINEYSTFIQALQDRRLFFRRMGATSTDHAALTAYTGELTPLEARDTFDRALRGKLQANDATRFTGHMLIEMARMSIEDGLVMQLHVGSYRDHNAALANNFGRDMGADIPVATEWTQNLRPLLTKFGTDPRLTLVLFCLDESTYSRELAPLAGHYPALRLGPPWWFHDSFQGMRRYFDSVLETAGLYNTVGFNDDTRAFPSIPTRHDLWRRTSADWLAGMVVRHLIDVSDAREMVVEMAYGLAKRAYHLDQFGG
jgi:glucuronate isomerase